MRAAAELAGQGCPSGTVVGADEQTAGRGRHGHSWHSEAAAGLYITEILRLPVKPDELPIVTLMLGLAAAEAIFQTCGIQCDLRWPNDVLIGSRKCAGILVQLLTLVGTMMTAMNIVREREIGTLDQHNVTPVPRGAFIAAKLVPFLSIALVEFVIGLIIARWLFGVPMIGSLTLLFFCTIIYLVVALGLGLWVSTIVHTQQQAMFVSFFLLLIYLLMSGLFTPVRSMPQWAQWIAELNPVKHFIVIIRSILLKGATFTDILRPLGILVLSGMIVLTLAVRQYSKRAA